MDNDDDGDDDNDITYLVVDVDDRDLTLTTAIVQVSSGMVGVMPMVTYVDGDAQIRFFNVNGTAVSADDLENVTVVLY